MRWVELFAGAGGAALGIERAGIEHAALCEWDPDACATLRAAGLGPVVEGDVRDLDAIEAVAGPGPLDGLWSSWPCQPDSTAGRRLGDDDPRDGWPATMAAVDRFRPRWFLGEQVAGSLQNGRNAQAVAWLRTRFHHAGHWVLRASDFGVPQDRVRVIVWAGPAPLCPPRLSHGVLGGPPVVSWGDALGFSEGLLYAAGRTGMSPPRPFSRPAATITSAGTAYLVAPGVDRRLTCDESAALQGFPAGYPFQGTDTNQRRQVGNAVPPALAEVVARCVLRAEDATLKAPAPRTAPDSPGQGRTRT